MNLSVEKCQFYQPWVSFLGNVASAKGEATGPKKFGSHHHLAQASKCKGAVMVSGVLLLQEIRGKVCK